LVKKAADLERYPSYVSGELKRSRFMKTWIKRIDQALAVPDDKELIPFC